MNERAKEYLVRGAEQLGIGLTPQQLGKLYAMATELKKWGRKVNLTAIHKDEEIAVKHFLDSLSLTKAVSRRGRLLDIGSGAGFPAIPLKIAHPELSVVAVDAVEKKVIFQRHVARIIGLTGFEAAHARAEELAPRMAGTFDFVVSRAFSDIPTFVRIAAPLLASGGKIIAMKGRGGMEEADAAGKSLAELGMTVTEVLGFTLPFSGDARSLVNISQQKEKPASGSDKT